MPTQEIPLFSTYSDTTNIDPRINNPALKTLQVHITILKIFAVLTSILAMSGSAVSPGLSGRQTRKQQQEKSDESHDLGYESQAAWYPHNPHKGRISVHDHPALSDELPPLARIRTFPIEEGDPIITFWETIRVEVHHILEHANLKWNSLSILHRRQTIQRTMFDTTLVITAERNEWGSDWEEALRKCHEKTAYGLKGDIRGLWIELRAQKFSRVADSVPTEPEPSLVEIHEHNERPAIGKSIGVTALPWSSGTMGGFVEIKNTTGSTEAMVCVLTNHHVARPTKKPSDEPEAAVKYDLRLDEIGRFHAAVTPGSSPPLPVSQPSYQDHERTLRLYEGQIREQSSEVKTLQVRADTGDKRSKKQLLLVKASLEKLEKEYERVSHFDLDFGKVWASSGYIKSARTGGGLDWALVQVRKDRIGHNLVRCHLCSHVRRFK